MSDLVKSVRLDNAKVVTGPDLEWDYHGWAETCTARFRMHARILSRPILKRWRDDLRLRAGDWVVEIMEAAPSNPWARPDDWRIEDEPRTHLLEFSAFTHDRGHEPYASEHRRIERFFERTMKAVKDGRPFRVRRVPAPKSRPWDDRIEVSAPCMKPAAA